MVATRTRHSAHKEKAHVRKILEPLVSSMRGQIFLCNLHCALSAAVSKELLNALLSIRPADARRMHEEDYLAHLKLTLQDKAWKLTLAKKSSAFAEFAPDDWVINVLPFASFQGYYEDATSSLSGHARLSKNPGESTSSFRVDATTTSVVWIAARNSISPADLYRSNAEGARDLLGLVHYGKKKELVAMHLKLNSPDVYRPTVIEANPNARFRHVDPVNPTEARWGRTVHLGRLENAGPTDEIGGVSELVMQKTRLEDCEEVKFYYLGATAIDQSTTEMDKKYLNHLLAGREATDIVDAMVDEICK